MARINLLPWRRELRKQQLQEFLVVTLLFAGAGLLAGGAGHFAIKDAISSQQYRNNLLTERISDLDKKIAEIRSLEDRKRALLARMEAIELLQTNRPLVVRLFDALQSTLPEGVSYREVSQSGGALTISGVAESETRVSSFMRRLEQSELFQKPTLKYIRLSTRGDDVSNLNDFQLEVRQVMPGSEEKEEERI